jgi:hypothetical protein
MQLTMLVFQLEVRGGIAGCKLSRPRVREQHRCNR